jgi:hypothetical protein
MCAASELCGYLSARFSTRCMHAASCSTASPLGITLAMRKSRSSKRRSVSNNSLRKERDPDLVRLSTRSPGIEGMPVKIPAAEQVHPQGDCVEGGGAAGERRKMEGRKGLPHHWKPYEHFRWSSRTPLLKKGTKQHAEGWDASSKDWAHMVLLLSHAEGGFGVTFNCVTKDAAFYTTTSRFVAWIGAFSQERQKLWLPKDDLQDSSSWSSPPLLLLRDIHSTLISQYNCKEVCAPSQSHGNVGTSARLSSQDGVPQ